MSHRNVELVIGRLVTDERFRRLFSQDAHGALREALESGMELTACELSALATLDAGLLTRLAEAIDPRIHRAELRGESHG